MARISEIRVKQTPQCYTASIRKVINFMEEYVPFIDEALPLIEAYLGKHGVLTVSAPLTCFHNMDLEKLDVEVGYHITQKLPDDGDITCQSCPSCKAVMAIDMGPYEQQDPTLMDLFGYIEAQKMTMQGPICYYYLNEPNQPESQYLTQMVIPVK